MKATSVLFASVPFAKAWSASTVRRHAPPRPREPLSCSAPSSSSALSIVPKAANEALVQGIAREEGLPGFDLFGAARGYRTTLETSAAIDCRAYS